MANLGVDLRGALVAALRANTTFASILGNSAGTVHAEGGDQPDAFLEGATGVAYCRDAGIEVVEATEASARTIYRFEVRIVLVDIRGVANALATAQMGLANALINKGATVFSTYFTDNGSNRLGGSGEWRVEDLSIVPLEGLLDPDRPEIAAIVACELWHGMALA